MPEVKPTMGLGFELKKYKTKDDMDFKVKIWDTPGHEKLKTFTLSFCKNVDGIVIVFDLTNRHSFDNLDTWLKNVSENASPSIPVVLVGNKADFEYKREVSNEEAFEFAQKWILRYFECSAKDGTNVSCFMEEILD